MKVFGHLNIYDAVFNTLTVNSGHHAICVVGKRGIGKATAVKCAIEEAVKQVVGNSGVVFLNNGSNPDIFFLNAEEGKSIISVEQVRNMLDFVLLKPTFLPFKCIVIDAINELNQSSSSAILKTLEEPPRNTFFVLISHNQYHQTLMSRCRKIKAKPLTSEEFSLASKGLQVSEDDKIVAQNNCGMLKTIMLSGGLELYNAIMKDVIDQTNNTVDLFDQVEPSCGLMQMMEHFFIRLVHIISRRIFNLPPDKLTSNEKAFCLSYVAKYYPMPEEMAEKAFAIINLFRENKTFSIDSSALIMSMIKIMIA